MMIRGLALAVALGLAGWAVDRSGNVAGCDGDVMEGDGGYD